MKKVMLALAVFVLLSVGCAFPNHNVFNHIDATDVNFQKMKMGKSCKYFALGVIPVTNRTLAKAAQNGKITKTKYIEYSFSHYVVFSKACVVVYGE